MAFLDAILRQLRAINGELDALEQREDRRAAKGGRLPASGAPPAPTGTPARPAGPSGVTGSSGGGGGGGAAEGGAGGGGQGRAGAVTGGLVRQVGTQNGFRAVSYLDEFCRRTTFRIPRPFDPTALFQGEAGRVDMPGWECADGSRYYDPDEFAKYEPARRTRTGSAGTPQGTGGGAPRVGDTSIQYGNTPTGQVTLPGGNLNDNKSLGAEVGQAVGAALASALQKLETVGRAQVAEAQQSRQALKRIEDIGRVQVDEARAVRQALRQRGAGIEGRIQVGG
jgi:hypothetical protein